MEFWGISFVPLFLSGYSTIWMMNSYNALDTLSYLDESTDIAVIIFLYFSVAALFILSVLTLRGRASRVEILNDGTPRPSSRPSSRHSFNNIVEPMKDYSSNRIAWVSEAGYPQTPYNSNCIPSSDDQLSHGDVTHMSSFPMSPPPLTPSAPPYDGSFSSHDLYPNCTPENVQTIYHGVHGVSSEFPTGFPNLDSQGVPSGYNNTSFA